MTCGMALALLRGAPSDAEFIDSVGSECSCEGCSASAFGSVQSDEDLIRIVISPFQIKNKKIVASALSAAEKRGLSTLRSLHATNEEIKLTAEEVVNAARRSDPNAGVFGVITMSTPIIKAVIDEGVKGPVYCIYDTALVEKPSHADIFQRVIDFPDLVKQARRQALFASVKETFVSVEDFRGGLLLPWASISAA